MLRLCKKTWAFLFARESVFPHYGVSSQHYCSAPASDVIMRLAALHKHGTYSSNYFNLFQQKQQLPDMEFGRRMATERDLEKTNSLKFSNVGNELESK